jgi:hypothetical protein
VFCPPSVSCQRWAKWDSPSRIKWSVFVAPGIGGEGVAAQAERRAVVKSARRM